MKIRTKGGSGRRQAASYLRRAVRRIVHYYRPDRIILFGSYAYGKPRRDSDLDLLVILRSRTPVFRREVKMEELLSDRPVAMDILVRTPEEVELARKESSPFWDKILKKGKTLYAARR